MSTAAEMPISSERSVPKLWAAVAILFAGVLMVVVAGCFLAGGVVVLSMETQSVVLLPDADTDGWGILLAVCYAMAILCGLCAVFMLAIGLHWLLRILRSPG